MRREHAVHGLEIEEQFGYWQAVRHGELIFVAGQVARAADGAPSAVGDLAGQVQRCVAQTEALLCHLGARLSEVVQLQVNVVEPAHQSAVRTILMTLNERLQLREVAGSVVSVDRLNQPEYMIEISSVARTRAKEHDMSGNSSAFTAATEDDELGVRGGPFAQAARGGGLLFISEIFPVDDKGQISECSVVGQFEICLGRLREVMTAESGSLDDVLYTTTYMTESVLPSDFQSLCDAHRQSFNGSNRPSGTMLYVPSMRHPNAKVMMTAIASASPDQTSAVHG